MSNLRNLHITDPDNKDYKAKVNSDGQLHIVAEGKVCGFNSTTDILDIDGVYLGTSQNIFAYNGIALFITSDVASAINGLEVQYSKDGLTNWRVAEYYTLIAGAEKWFTPPAFGGYYRVKYTNGGIAQTSFELTTYLHKMPIKWSSHNIDVAITGQDDAQLTKSVITGVNPNGIYDNVNITLDNDLSISDNSSGLSIARGDVTGSGFIHKFGNAPDFDATDGDVTIWDGADDSDINQMVYQYSSTDDIDSLVCTDSGATQSIEILGLDSSYNEVTQTIVLTGQTRVPLSTNLIRIFRMINRSSTSIGVGEFVYCYVNSSITLGVPDDSTKVRAVINNGNNQTEMAIYTIPAGRTGYMRDWYSSSAGGNKGTNLIIKVKARPFGESFQIKHRMSWSGTIPYQHKYTEPEKYEEKTDIEISCQLAETGVVGAAVAGGFDLVIETN